MRDLYRDESLEVLPDPASLAGAAQLRASILSALAASFCCFYRC
jgi:hypothetical protein